MGDSAFAQQLAGYSLTTAEILYRIPDHRSILQTFIWQDYDQFPTLPKLHGFLQFWSRQLDGPLHRIRVTHKGLVSPCEFQYRDGQFVRH